MWRVEYFGCKGWRSVEAKYLVWGNASFRMCIEISQDIGRSLNTATRIVRVRD